MRRTWIAIAALVFAAGSAHSAIAVWVDTNQCRHCGQSPCDSTAHYIRSGYHRNKEWPWPYVCADRIAVRAMFELMRDVVNELSPRFQVIVCDHADLPEPWFDQAVRERWRHGAKLIPADWLNPPQP